VVCRDHSGYHLYPGGLRTAGRPLDLDRAAERVPAALRAKLSAGGRL
jgi:hypothetical protein